MKQKQAHLSRLGTGLFSFLCIVYVLPIVVVLMNSFKKKSYISLEPFQLPNETTLTGLDNYTAAIDQYGFLDAVGWTVFIWQLHMWLSRKGDLPYTDRNLLGFHKVENEPYRDCDIRSDFQDDTVLAQKIDGFYKQSRLVKYFTEHPVTEGKEETK